MTLSALFWEVVDSFEELLVKLQDDIESGESDSGEYGWLQNCTTALISWGIDIRMRDSKLISTLEDTVTGVRITSILNDHKKRIDGHFQQSFEHRSLESVKKEANAMSAKALQELRSLTKTIHMIYAIKHQKGPSASLMQQIARMNTKHNSHSSDFAGAVGDVDKAIAVSQQNMAVAPSHVPDSQGMLHSFNLTPTNREEKVVSELDETIRLTQQDVDATLNHQKVEHARAVNHLGNLLGNRCPWVVARNDDGMTFTLPIGSAHGIYEQAEFILDPPNSEGILSVYYVETFQCKAKLLPGHSQLSKLGSITVAVLKWSLGKDVLRVKLQSAFEEKFVELIEEHLRTLVAGNIEIFKYGETEPETRCINLCERDDNYIDISGPEDLIGYREPVRGLVLHNDTLEMQAMNSAIAVSHLSRFKQILQLRKQATQSMEPFDLDRQDPTSGNELSEGDEVSFYFKNTGKDDLYVSISGLSSGFHIKQLYPGSEQPALVKPNMTLEPCPLRFALKIPGELKQKYQRSIHRDIVRFIITKHKQYSAKWVELPNIWDKTMEERNTKKPGRNMIVRSDPQPKSDWWVKDFEFFTSQR